MSELQKSKTWLFLGGLIETSAKSRVKIADGFVLRRANGRQRAAIRQFFARQHIDKFSTIHEQKVTFVGSRVKFEALEERD